MTALAVYFRVHLQQSLENVWYKLSAKGHLGAYVIVFAFSHQYAGTQCAPITPDKTAMCLIKFGKGGTGDRQTSVRNLTIWMEKCTDLCQNQCQSMLLGAIISA